MALSSAILGLFIIAVLTAHKVNGAILIGIVVITILGIPLGVTEVPDSIVKIPDIQGLGNEMCSW